MALLAGIKSTAVFRLKKTWAALSKPRKTDYEELEELMTRAASFSNLRRFMKEAPLPVVPYLGMHLTGEFSLEITE